MPLQVERTNRRLSHNLHVTFFSSSFKIRALGQNWICKGHNVILALTVKQMQGRITHPWIGIFWMKFCKYKSHWEDSLLKGKWFHSEGHIDHNPDQ